MTATTDADVPIVTRTITAPIELCGHAVSRFRDRIVAAVEGDAVDVIDLSSVERLDSAGAAALVGAVRRARLRRHPVRLDRPSDAALVGLRRVGLARWFAPNLGEVTPAGIQPPA